MRIRHELDVRISAAFSALLGRDGPALVREADSRFGDYQANGVMGQAKRDKSNPRELAARLVEALDLEGVCEPPTIAGPGFINLTLRTDFLAQRLQAMAADESRLDVDPVGEPQTIIVDLSSPNVAKPLHVGHLRSTILGDAIVRILRFLGHRVIADNHVGDWGTQFGMLIVGFRRWGDEAKLQASPTDELERVYRLANDAGKQDPTVAEQARAELVKLQAGNADNLALWKRFIAATRVELDEIYNRLDVHFDEWRGESSYHEALAPLVDKLLADGIATIDDGATLIFFDADDRPELADNPFLIRKTDGAFLYATTDLATLQYRLNTHQADEVVYVVDKRQALHFKQLFAAARKLGWRLRLHHVDFGAILGPDGRPIKTREGGSVRLADLLAEAAARATAIIEEKNPELDADQRARVAEIVGIGAVKYADLSQNRSSDYRFDWEKMLAFDGNTAPYLQYAHARIRSIFRKLGDPDWQAPADAASVLDHPSERALAFALLRFADVVHDLPQDYLLHQLSDHLFALAQAFNAFYRDCPVLNSTGDTHDTRLTLCLVTARQIALGLSLLGIAAPERM